MPIHDALSLVETVTEASRDDGSPTSAGVRAQAARVRSLVDQVDFSHPADRRLTPLRHQLADEIASLTRLVEADSADSLEAETMEGVDVLVVDDEDAALRTTKRVLEQMGYVCRVATRGEEALEEYDRRPAAIVLTDWCMPGMDGLALCRALKARDPQPYVLICTAFHDKSSLLDVVSGGADDFIRKPLELGELEARLFAASRLIRVLRAARRPPE